MTIKWYIVLEIWSMWQAEFFVILDCFLPYYPPNNPKNQNFEKMKTTPGDIIILHIYTKNYDQMMFGSWDMVRERCNCYFSFWAIFSPFTPLTAQKIKILKKWKNQLEISSFYICVTKIMIRWSWDMLHDRGTDGWTEKVTYRGGCPT